MTRPAPPEPGWTTPAEVTRVIDGDTVEVTVTRKLRIRLLDCWAAESRSTDIREKTRGIAAMKYLQKLIGKIGSTVRLHVPTGAGQELAEIFTFGRVLGRLWLADGRDVSTAMRKARHATKTKRKKL